MKKILVTGVSGFTGSHLARRLLTEGHGVRSLVRPASLSKDTVKELVDLGLEPMEGDLCNPRDVEKSVKGVDHVYNIAALYRSEGSEKLFYDTNVLGTKHVTDAAIESGVESFVHCSTVGVHGDIKNPPADENAPLAPGDPYQVTKLEGENYVKEKIECGALRGSIFRPSGIYGPGDTRFLKLFRAIAKKRFFMIGRGDVFYHLTYIDDLVDGIILCATVPEAVGKTFILAGPECPTLKEMVEVIAETLGTRLPRVRIPVLPVYAAGWLCEKTFKPLGLEPPIYRRRVEFFTKSRAFDITRAKEVLGFNPRVGIREGIKRTANWYKTQNLL